VVIVAVVYTLRLTPSFPTMESLCRLIGSAGGVFYQTKESKVQKLDLVVVRVNKMGSPCNARPCYNCLDMMKAVGIRKVYYSIGPDEIVCENVKDMISIQASSVAKHIAKLNGNCTVDNPNKFYENLLLKYFPKIVRKHNLESFIAHNLTHVLPTYRAVLNRKSEVSLVIIYDSTDRIIASAHVVP
jgi:hypothetical protein